MSGKRHRLDKWISKLALLSVCRIWRELALPSVHRVSFVELTLVSIHSDKNDSSVSDQHDSDGSDVAGDHSKQRIHVVNSNLDIINKSVSRCWPRTLHLFVSAPCFTYATIFWITDHIRRHKSLLTNVARIAIIYKRWSRKEWLTELTDDDTTAISYIGKGFSQLLPCIRYIEANAGTDEEAFECFTQSLFKSFAHQLIGVNCPQAMLEKVESFSKNLNDIAMLGYRNITSYVPQIYAENLTTLALRFIQSSFSWSSFEGNSGSGTINFANLRSLVLLVDSVDLVHRENGDSAIGYPAHTFDYNIIAPKLERVALQLCPFTLSFLSSIHGLTTICDVVLRMEWAIMCFKEFNLDVARDELSYYANNSQTEYHIINEVGYMNDILSIQNLATYSQAGVGLDGSPLDIEHIYWEYLSHLQIYGQFNFGNLRALISRTPILEGIEIHVSDMQEVCKQIPEMYDETAIVEPLSSSLKLISIYYQIACTESDSNTFGAYLDKLIPTD